MSNLTTPGTAWNRARYSFYAPFYDAIVAPFQGGRRRSIELLAPQPGEGMLVVGCGTGLDLPLLPPSVQRSAAWARAIGPRPKLWSDLHRPAPPPRWWCVCTTPPPP